jgi:hypothetical protein
MTGKMRIGHQLSQSTNLSLSIQSRLLNVLGLSDKDIPLSLREQFGYSKKHSVLLGKDDQIKNNHNHEVLFRHELYIFILQFSFSDW